MKLYLIRLLITIPGFALASGFGYNGLLYGENSCKGCPGT